MTGFSHRSECCTVLRRPLLLPLPLPTSPTVHSLSRPTSSELCCAHSGPPPSPDINFATILEFYLLLRVCRRTLARCSQTSPSDRGPFAFTYMYTPRPSRAPPPTLQFRYLYSLTTPSDSRPIHPIPGSRRLRAPTQPEFPTQPNPTPARPTPPHCADHIRAAGSVQVPGTPLPSAADTWSPINVGTA